MNRIHFKISSFLIFVTILCPQCGEEKQFAPNKKENISNETIYKEIPKENQLDYVPPGGLTSIKNIPQLSKEKVASPHESWETITNFAEVKFRLPPGVKYTTQADKAGTSRWSKYWGVSSCKCDIIIVKTDSDQDFKKHLRQNFVDEYNKNLATYGPDSLEIGYLPWKNRKVYYRKGIFTMNGQTWYSLGYQTMSGQIVGFGIFSKRKDNDKQIKPILFSLLEYLE